MVDAPRRTHILVINDTQAIVDVLRELLEGEGYHVSVSIGTVDVARIKTLKPDLIVQDLLVASGALETGWTFLTRSRLDPQLARIPLILCTTAVETVRDPAMAANLDRLGVRVVLKPFEVDDLLTAITEVLTAQALINQARVDAVADET